MNLTFYKFFATITFVLATFFYSVNSASAQPEDFDQFQNDVDRLFRELSRKNDKSGSGKPFGDNVHEMSPEQFQEFQRQFFDRFFNDDGSDRTTKDKGVGSLVRNRPVGDFEKQNPNQLAAFKPIVQHERKSIVTIEIRGKTVALGTVIDTAGNILTKASELNGAQKVNCVLADSTKQRASLIAISQRYDLALLHLENGKEKTAPVRWSQKLEVGRTVVTADQTGKPLASGVVSVGPRSLVGKNLAFLGVGPGPHARGVEVLSVEPQTSASRAGLKVGDIIVMIADVPTKTVDSLVNVIRAHRPRTKVVIEYFRSESKFRTVATLDSATMPTEREMRIRLMNRMGAIPSKRSTEFPSVFQHDSPLLPEQCGGPIFNLDGEAIGINIARGGRTESFAIPAAQAAHIINSLKATQN